MISLLINNKYSPILWSSQLGGFLARHLEGAGKIILKTSEFTIKKFFNSTGQLISYAMLPKHIPLWCMKSLPIKSQNQ
jgi:hypothetical protein